MANIRIIKHPTVYNLENCGEREFFFKVNNDGLINISTDYDFSTTDSNGTYYPECELLTISWECLKEIMEALAKYEDLK